MPSLEVALPKLCRHKDQACMYLGGRRIYLGKWGSPAARQKYDRHVAEWLANGRAVPPSGPVCVNQVLLAFLRHAKQYYVKDGVQTNEVNEIKAAIRPVVDLYGSQAAESFGPLALEAVRDRMIEAGWSRKHINKQVSRVIRAFKWTASKQLVPAAVPDALRTLPGLRKGRTAARETDPVEPVCDEVVEATLKHLSPIVGDMVRIQRLTGMRPGEVCLLRPDCIDRTGDVWWFTPATHKTQHQEKDRVVPIGPQTQAILAPYLNRACDAYCFDPREAPGARSNSKERYTKDSYGRAVRRAAKKAGVENWSPNRLRHARASEIRAQHGLEAAQVTLGHQSADVTQVYAKRDRKSAALVALQSG